MNNARIGHVRHAGAHLPCRAACRCDACVAPAEGWRPKSTQEAEAAAEAAEAAEEAEEEEAEEAAAAAEGVAGAEEEGWE